MKYNIEKSVPIPKGSGVGRRTKYPFSEMDVGDSIFLDGEFATIAKCKAYAAAKGYQDRTGRVFCGRKVAGGVRIWRTK